MGTSSELGLGGSRLDLPIRRAQVARLDSEAGGHRHICCVRHEQDAAVRLPGELASDAAYQCSMEQPVSMTAHDHEVEWLLLQLSLKLTPCISDPELGLDSAWPLAGVLQGEAQELFFGHTVDMLRGEPGIELASDLRQHEERFDG